MAAVPLFRNTNMAGVTSHENTLFTHVSDIEVGQKNKGTLCQNRLVSNNLHYWVHISVKVMTKTLTFTCFALKALWTVTDVVVEHFKTDS